MSSASLSEAVRAGASAGPRVGYDRDNPSLFDAIENDPVTPIPRAIKQLFVRDLRRPTRRYLFPIIRLVTTLLVHAIILLKRIMPFKLSWLGALSWSTKVISGKFASAEAQEVLLRHFNIETQLVNFVARNATAGRAPEYDLLPTCIDELGDHHSGMNAIALHDANIMNLFIDLGTTPGTDVESRRALKDLDFSMLEMPALTLSDGKQWIKFDLPSVLYVSALMIAIFFDDPTIERAVNSFQLDEPLLAALANMTGDETLRALTPCKWTLWMGSPTYDPARDLHWHFLLHEQVYERMLRLKRLAEAERSAA